MHTILLVGEDEILLRTRAEVLRRTGCEVVASDPASALEIQAGGEFDLVVLCHSLSTPTRIALTNALRLHWPETQILLVVTQREWDQVDAQNGIDGVSSADPQRLVGKTAEMLRRLDRVTMVPIDLEVRGGVVRAGPYAH